MGGAEKHESGGGGGEKREKGGKSSSSSLFPSSRLEGKREEGCVNTCFLLWTAPQIRRHVVLKRSKKGRGGRRMTKISKKIFTEETLNNT